MSRNITVIERTSEAAKEVRCKNVSDITKILANEGFEMLTDI
jgi:hypothetical protein